MAEALLTASGLSKSFRGLRAVADVSFTVGTGEIVALIGPNGAGKTTCFNLIAGAMLPDAGEARLAGRLLTGLRADEVCRAHAAGASSSVRQALGFEELLRGDVAAMQQRTRRYAKRQLTWLRKLPGAHHVDLTDRTPDDAARDVLAMIP